MSETNFYRFYATDGEGERVTVTVVSAKNHMEAFSRGIASIDSGEAREILARLDGRMNDESDPAFFTVDVLETLGELHEALEDMRLYRMFNTETPTWRI